MKTYNIQLIVTDPKTYKSLSGSITTDIIQDMKAMNGKDALHEMMQTLIREHEEQNEQR
jgi:hypothetical protein